MKWAGGKSSLIEDITKLFPLDFNKRCYHEPFVGGGAVFFGLEPNKGSIIDINENLIKFYRVVREKPYELINEALKYQEYSDCKKKYNEFRDRFNKEKDTLSDVKLAALFLYFNKTSYNGLYRENSNGYFNVPFGKYKNPTIVYPEKIKNASRILNKVKIYNADFEYIRNIVNEGDICYFDPPYYSSKSNNGFTDYSKDGFNLSDHKRLKKLCVNLNKKGVYLILSNSNTKIIKEMYELEGFNIKTVTTKRMISCNASSRKDTQEILIYNTDMF